VKLVAAHDDPQVQFMVNGLRTRFQKVITGIDERKEFVYLLARFVKSFHFLTSVFTYPKPIAEFAAFAEYVGPQLIKVGGVSELMNNSARRKSSKRGSISG
jgi:type I restriction enzyme R subunit